MLWSSCFREHLSNREFNWNKHLKNGKIAGQIFPPRQSTLVWEHSSKENVLTLRSCMGFDCNLLNFNVLPQLFMVKLFPKRPNFTSETLRARIFRNNSKHCAQLLEVQYEICYNSSKNAVLHAFCYVCIFKNQSQSKNKVWNLKPKCLWYYSKVWDEFCKLQSNLTL